MVVSFKKTAECQYRRNDHHWSSLGHRRLRFSFQINDFKDQDRKNRTPLFSAGGRRRRRFSRLGSLCQELLLEEVLAAVPNPVGPGGGGFLKKAVPRVNRAFQPFRRDKNRSFQSAKNHPGKPHWLPRFVTEAIRLKRGDYVEPAREARSF